MSDNTETLSARRPPGRPVRDHARPHIKLPDGEELWPRADIADAIDVDPRTVQRMNLPTIMVGGAAYHPHDESLRILAGRIRRPGQPRRRRSRG